MKLSFLIILFFVVSCGKSSTRKFEITESSIYGGQTVESDDIVAQSTVAIGTDGSPEICSGTLISENLVITAAHCVVGYKKYKHFFSAPTYTVLIESKIILFGVKARDSIKVIKGAPDQVASAEIKLPKDNEFYQNLYDSEVRKFDIALIKLAKNVSKSFKPVAILDPTYILPAATELLIAGYGESESNGWHEMNDLRKTYRPFEERINETDFLLNQLERKEGVYKGDSGGPAYLEVENELLLVGATSSANSKTNAYFMYVPAFKNFILNAAKEMNATPPVFKMPN